MCDKCVDEIKAVLAAGGPTEERCAECGEPFTVDEWDVRHSNEDGEDVHDRCCKQCGRNEAAVQFALHRGRNETEAYSFANWCNAHPSIGVAFAWLAWRDEND